MRDKRIYIPTRHDKAVDAVVQVVEHFEGVDFNPNMPETTIQVQSKISTSNNESSSVAVTYKSDKKKVNWYQRTSGPNFHNLKQGVVDLEFALDGVGWWKGGGRNQIHLNFRRDNDIKVHATAAKPPWWAGSGQLPPHYEKLTMTLDLDIAMGSLDYFLTTNLLFPGQHVFIADSPTPDADYNHGLGVPRDMILTGQVTGKVEHQK